MKRPQNGRYTHARATCLPDGRPAMFEAVWDTKAGRGWYRILAGSPPMVAVVNGERLERGDLSPAEFQAVCRRWLLE
jgi:hypothetical protein